MAAFSLLVTHAPFEQQYAFSAYRFVRSALNYAAWVELGTQFAIPLNVCVTAANRRGVINKQDAIENSQQGFNLAEPFAEVGLGSLVELMQVSDRVIQF